MTEPQGQTQQGAPAGEGNAEPKQTPPPQEGADQAPPPASPPPQKFWEKFDSEDAAKQHYTDLEQKHSQAVEENTKAKKWVDQVSPYLHVDEKTGEVFYREPQKSQPTPEPSQDEVVAEYEKDKVGFIRREVQKGLDEGRKQTDLEVRGRGEFIKKYQDDPDFQEFRPKVEEAMRFVPVQQRGSVQVWETAWKLVKSEGVDKIVERKVRAAMDEKNKDKQAIDQSKVDAGTGAGQKPPDAPVQLTDDEKKVADGLGMSHKDYADQKAEIAKEKGV